MLAPKEELQEGVQGQLAKLKYADLFETERGFFIFIGHTTIAGIEVVRDISSKESRYMLANSGSVFPVVIDFRECTVFNKDQNRE